MKKATFEWDEEKISENQSKHGVSFIAAQQAFLDPNRIMRKIFPITVKKIGITAWALLTKVS